MRRVTGLQQGEKKNRSIRRISDKDWLSLVKYAEVRRMRVGEYIMHIHNLFKQQK